MDINDFIGFAIGIMGILLSIVLHYSPLRKKRLFYYCENLEYDDKSINNNKKNHKKFNETFVTFWNASSKTLFMKDFPKSERPRISIPSNSHMQSFKLLSRNEKSNKIRITKKIGENNVQNIFIGFDYIDKRQGALIKIIHDGNGDDIKLQGKIIGLGIIKKIIDNPFQYPHELLFLENVILILGSSVAFKLWLHLTSNYFIAAIAGIAYIILLIYANYKHSTALSKELRGFYHNLDKE